MVNEEVKMVCDLIRQRRKTKNIQWGLMYEDNIRENETDCCPLQAAIDEKTGKHGDNWSADIEAAKILEIDYHTALNIMAAADNVHPKALTWEEQEIRKELENACFAPIN